MTRKTHQQFKLKLKKTASHFMPRVLDIKKQVVISFSLEARNSTFLTQFASTPEGRKTVIDWLDSCQEQFNRFRAQFEEAKPKRPKIKFEIVRRSDGEFDVECRFPNGNLFFATVQGYRRPSEAEHSLYSMLMEVQEGNYTITKPERLKPARKGDNAK